MPVLETVAIERLSIVIPTYNERQNLDPLLLEFSRLRQEWKRDFDILVVDDDSPDGTAKAAEAIANAYGLPLTVVSRTANRGLGRATIEGMCRCGGDLVCVMDADLSHPPSLIPRLLENLGDADGVVASRYIEGGRITSWPLRRRILSAVATQLVRGFFRPACHDPLSGFFVIRRSALGNFELTGVGNKPLVEVLARQRLIVREVPYEFMNRKNGQSKLTFRGILIFVRGLMELRRERAQAPDSRISSRATQELRAED